MRLVPVILAVSVTAGVSVVPNEILVGDGLSADSSSGSSSSSSSSRWDENAAQELHYQLFPNRTKSPGFDKNGRSLSFDNIPYTTKVQCQTCDNLQTCQILNTLLIQEVYYPSINYPATGTTTAQIGTCEIIEQRGIRLALEIFGPDKTFRDTPTCQGTFLCVLAFAAFERITHTLILIALQSQPFSCSQGEHDVIMLSSLNSILSGTEQE